MFRLQPTTSLIALAGLAVGLWGLPPSRPAQAATILTVTTTADLPAPCLTSAVSLRCAFTQANADGSGDTIAFHIPATDHGCVRTVIQSTTVRVCTISPTQAAGGSLPVLFVSNTLIDGYTQTGARPNTAPAGQGDNAMLTIQLDGTRGSTALLDGIAVIGSGNTICDLSITNFTDGMGIHLGSMFTGTPLDAHNTVAGNFLGLAPDDQTGGNSINNVTSNSTGALGRTPSAGPTRPPPT